MTSFVELKKKSRILPVLNSNKWGIKFPPKFEREIIEFLNLTISRKEDLFQTATFFKKVDANSYLDFP